MPTAAWCSKSLRSFLLPQPDVSRLQEPDGMEGSALGCLCLWRGIILWKPSFVLLFWLLSFSILPAYTSGNSSPALQTSALLSVLKKGPVNSLRSLSTFGAAVHCFHNLILMPLIEHWVWAEVCEGEEREWVWEAFPICIFFLCHGNTPPTPVAFNKIALSFPLVHRGRGKVPG